MKRKTFSIIVFLWFVSTLAFTCLGYGSDNDAWLVAENARIIARIGEYTRSRTVGFPLFELAVTPLVNRGQWYLSNMLPLSFGFLIFAALYRLLNINEFRYPFVTIVTLMYLPIIIKNASSTMDYIPSLALLMWAYVFLRESKWIPAGLMIGVATGFRPTSILFAIPAVVYSFTETKRIRQASNLLLVSVLSGAFTFSPVLLKYGFNVSPLSTHLKGKMLLFITGYHALRLFGIPQTIVIGVALIAITYRVMHQEKMNPYFLFHFSNLFIWSLLFLRFPYEPEYMLPLVPSVIFLLDRYLSKNGTILISILLLSYHFIQVDALGGQSGQRRIDLTIQAGYTIRDVQDRIFKLSVREAANHYTTSTKTILMFGVPSIPAANDLWVYKDQMYCQIKGNLCVSPRIVDLNRLEELNKTGYRLVLWRGEMPEYYRMGITIPEFVEVVDNLGNFFGTQIKGKAINQQ